MQNDPIFQMPYNPTAELIHIPYSLPPNLLFMQPYPIPVLQITKMFGSISDDILDLKGPFPIRAAGHPISNLKAFLNNMILVGFEPETH